MMINKQVFGKGEAALIDRKKEIFPPAITATSQAQAEAFHRYHDAYLGEYFYILRKIFHTFAFDMKEFAVDFYEVPVEVFVRALTWLTYVQTIIYEMDVNTEQEGAGSNQRSAMDLAQVGQNIVSFLREHDLLDDDIERCVNEVVEYLLKEQSELHGKSDFTRDEIFKMLDLKSADLEMLRRILMRVCSIPVNDEEMRIFKLIDKIREVFDDIRDYEEDKEIANFNTVIFLRKLGGDVQRGTDMLREFVSSEMRQVHQWIAELDKERAAKLSAIYSRLEEEQGYFLAELDKLPAG